GTVAPATRAGGPCRCGRHGFRGMELRKASSKDFPWRAWISAPESKIRSTSESATTKSARVRARIPVMVPVRVPVEARCKLTGTRFRGTCAGVLRFTSRSATRAGLDSRALRIRTRFFPVASHWTAGVLRGTLWASECRDTTLDTGIATSGLGPMPISPALTVVRAHSRRAHSRRWYTKCPLAWFFAKRCFGMRERRTNSAICERAKEIKISSAGLFVVHLHHNQEMDFNWKQRSMGPDQAS